VIECAVALVKTTDANPGSRITVVAYGLGYYRDRGQGSGWLVPNRNLDGARIHPGTGRKRGR
jgi:hypothetical protein